MNATRQEQTTSLTSPHTSLSNRTGHCGPHHLRSTLHQHMLPRIKDFECPVCKQRFTRKHNMVSHQATHNEDKVHQCTQCDMHFRRVHDLKRHRTLHTGERPFRCEWCHRAFARPDALIRHHKSPHACPGTKTRNSTNNTSFTSQFPLPRNVRFDMTSGPWKTDFEPGLVTIRRESQPTSSILYSNELQYFDHRSNTSSTFMTGEDAFRARFCDLYSKIGINSASHTTGRVGYSYYPTSDALPSPADSQFGCYNNSSNGLNNNGSLPQGIVNQYVKKPRHSPEVFNESHQMIGSEYRAVQSQSGFPPIHNMNPRRESNPENLAIVPQKTWLDQNEVARRSNNRTLSTYFPLNGQIPLLQIERILPHPSHLRTRLIAQDSMEGISSGYLHLGHTLQSNNVIHNDVRPARLQRSEEYSLPGVAPASSPSKFLRTNGHQPNTSNYSSLREWTCDRPITTVCNRSKDKTMTQGCAKTLVEKTRRSSLCFDEVNREVSIDNALEHGKKMDGTLRDKDDSHPLQSTSKVSNDAHAHKTTLPHDTSYSRQNPTISLMCNNDLKDT